MPRRLLKRLTPSATAIRANRCLRIFGDFIHDPNLWHLNRHAVARAFATGLFWAFVPVPFQMVFAAGVAIIWRANIPLSVALVWITNPVTVAPIFYATYKLGAWILGSPAVAATEGLNVHWFVDSLGVIWKPLFIGSLLTSFVAGGIGYFGIHGLWRWYTVRRFRRRRIPVPAGNSGSP